MYAFIPFIVELKKNINGGIVSYFLMISLFSFLNLLDLPLDWSEKMTFFLILFSAGVLCVTCAILLAIYLLRSDRLLDISNKQPVTLSYPTDEEESRLSRLKFKINSYLSWIKNKLKKSQQKIEPLAQDTLDSPKDLPTTNLDDCIVSTDDDP